MNTDISEFFGEIWGHTPLIIILLVAGLITFIISVIDTHRHRKALQKWRDRTKRH